MISITQETILNNLTTILSKLLNNQVCKSIYYYDISKDLFVYQFEFQHIECFGKVLIHKINAHELKPLLKSVNYLDLVDNLLLQIIEKLPREDRLERKRIWNIKN